MSDTCCDCGQLMFLRERHCCAEDARNNPSYRPSWRSAQPTRPLPAWIVWSDDMRLTIGVGKAARVPRWELLGILLGYETRNEVLP